MPPKKARQTPIKPPDPQHPPPFTKAPETLSPFLAQLDPSQVYITHIDRTQLHVKKQTFFFAILLNATIAALLAWRAYIAVPKYLALTQTVLGYDSSATVDADSKDKIWILLSRTAMMVFDYLLVRLVVPWPGKNSLGIILKATVWDERRDLRTGNGAAATCAAYAKSQWRVGG
jgi:hypothetical protein